MQPNKKSSVVFNSVLQLAFFCVERDKRRGNLDRSSVLHGITNIIYILGIYMKVHIF